MKIHKVGIKNLNSLRMETTIDFTKEPIEGSGLFAITGDTGAGKTTILDAVTLALYGRIHRNKDVKEVMSYGAYECYAEVEFESNDKNYFVKWSLHRAGKKPDGNFQQPKRELSKWNAKNRVFEIIAEKVKEVDQAIEEITGLDYDRFTRSVMLSQGDFAAFLKSGEKDRSDLLERITGTEVYSQLSMAAFRRYREEENKLKELNSTMEGLRVLNEDELIAFEKELNHLQEESKSLKKELETKQSQLNWLQKIESLETQLSALREEIEVIDQEKQTVAEELEKLAQHQKTIPFHTQLSKLEDHLASKKEIELEMNQLNNSFLQIEESEKSQKEILDHFVLELKTVKDTFTKKSKLFDKVTALDIEIKAKKEPFQKDQNELEKQSDHLTKLQKQENSLEERLTQIQQHYLETTKWLKENKIYKNLIDDLPKIKLHYRSLQEIYKNKKEIDREIKLTEKSLQNAQKQQLSTNKKLANNEKEIRQLTDNFSAQSPEEFALSRTELLNKLSEEIENLGTHNKNLQQLKLLNDEYQSLLKELSHYEEQLENLRQEEQSLNKEIMSSLEALDQLRSKLMFKQQVYEEQLMIANYEKDRNSLKEGDPCPLCFSKTHPFRKKQFKPYTDQAKKELDIVKKQLDTLYQPYRNLLNRQKDLEIQIEALAGNEVKDLNGQVQNQVSKLLEYEGKISIFAPELSQTDFSLTQRNLLSLKISDFEKKIADRRKKRKRLIVLDSKLEQSEKTVQQNLNILKDQELEIARIEENLKLNREKSDSLQSDFEKTTTAFNKILKRYGFTFEVETGKQTLSQLETEKLKYEQLYRKEIDLKGEQELCQQEKRQLKEQIEQQKKHVKQFNIEIDAKADAIMQLQNQRKELFGDLDPAFEKNRLEQQMSETETKHDAAKLQWDEVILAVKTTKNSISEKEKQKSRIIIKTNQLEESLNAAIYKVGFESIEQLRLAILPEKKAEAIQKNKELLKEKEIKTQQSLKINIKELKNEKAKKLTKDVKSNITSDLKDLDDNFQQFQQGIGSIREKINHNDQLKKERLQLFKSIESQRSEFNRWAKLNEIIGMADGKKFRVFAQGLTLKKLTILANKHLQSLNGRYFIYKRSDENLTLDIIDTFQADNIRSMNTLSGGESFLVSLALALGLSDLAGRNTVINSLFIDEGFGSLDETTLDLAISTLENLQSKGKTIGVISHVKALKERIGTQIQVKKKASGFSELEIIG